MLGEERWVRYEKKNKKSSYLKFGGRKGGGSDKPTLRIWKDGRLDLENEGERYRGV